MRDQFCRIFEEKIHRPGAEKLLAWLKTTDFFEAPASTKYHLSRQGGLVEHSVNVYHRLRELYHVELAREQSTDVEMDDATEESIAISGLLHDLCKVNAYKGENRKQKIYDPEIVSAADRRRVKRDDIGPYIMEDTIVYRHGDELPFGHGEKSVYLITNFMELTKDEALAIRWHMGAWQNGDKPGAGTAFSMSRPAVMTHIADMLATYLDEQ